MHEEKYDALAEARSASSVGELHRVLVTHPPGGSGHHGEAVELFSRFHQTDPVGAVDTAVLVCVCWRWHRVPAKVISGIVAAGVLDDEGLDELADRLFWPDRPTYDHPLDWFALNWIDVAAAVGRTTPDTEQNRIVTSMLSTTPAQMRRWAAGHLLARGTTRLKPVLTRGDKLDAYSSEAVLAGALDVYGHLHPDDAPHAIERGLASGRGLVRRQALPLLAARDGWPAALSLARRDPDASVRRWAEREGNVEPSSTLFD